jgi:hypothetical protein
MSSAAINNCSSSLESKKKKQRQIGLDSANNCIPRHSGGLLVFGDFVDDFLLEEPVSEIGLFVVKGTQQKVKDGVLHHHASIGLVLLDHVSVVHGPVVLTDGKIRSFVLVHIDHDSTKREKKGIN